MKKLHKAIVAVLAIAALLTLCACDTQQEPPQEQQTTAEQSQEQQTTEPKAIEATIAERYNAAVEKLGNAHSYTMTGSTNSSSAMGEVLTTVVTSVDCKYAKNEAGEAEILMQAEQSISGAEPTAHTTYIADGTYYISAYGMNYAVNTNDFGDYDASMFVKRVEESAIYNYEMQTGANGTGFQIRFEIPFGIYASEALDDMIGMFADDSLLQQDVTVIANIDSDGWLTSIYISMENQTSFDAEPIEQAIVVSLKFSAYNETVVTEPADLETYEAQTESGGQNPDGADVPEDFTGDSLD